MKPIAGKNATTTATAAAAKGTVAGPSVIISPQQTLSQSIDQLASPNKSSVPRDLLNSLVNEQEKKRSALPPSKSLEDLITPLLSLNCAKHKIRQYDHICQNPKCAFPDILLCSKCTIQDEQHVHTCKNTLVTIEKYVPQKIKEITGKNVESSIDSLLSEVTVSETELAKKIVKLRESVESDMKEIIGSVQTLILQLQKSLLKEIDVFASSQSAILKDFTSQLTTHKQTVQNEGEVIASKQRLFLSTNFDISNNFQVQEFMRNLRSSLSFFSPQTELLKLREELTFFANELKINPIYLKGTTSTLKQSIYALIQAPLAASTKKLSENALLDFKSSVKQAPSPFETDWISGSDKQSVIVSSGNDDLVISTGLQEKVCASTSHKLPINSLAVINADTFVTCGNEGKLKFWGFTKNYVLHERCEVSLSHLALHVLSLKSSSRLFVATSKGEVLVFDTTSTDSVVALTAFTGHTRTVRNLAILPEKRQVLLSLSYDRTIKAWDISQERFGQELLSISLEKDEECKFFEANDTYVVVGTVSGHVFIYRNIYHNETQLIQDIQLISKIRCSKDKITSVTLGQKNPHTAFVGSANGSITILDLSKVPVIYKPDQVEGETFSEQPSGGCGGEESQQQSWIVQKILHAHKDRIGSINLIEDGFILVTSWDGLANLWDLSTKSIVSSTRYSLGNDEKKHSDGCQTKLAPCADNNNAFHVIATGNNDRKVQILHLQLQVK